MLDRPRDNSVQSVNRSVSLLRFLAEPHADGSSSSEGLPLASIAKGVGLTPSTTHRLLRTLLNEHLVEQDPFSERYRLGPLAGVLGQAYLASAGLERAQPILRALCRDTSESVSLASLHGTTALVVLQEHSPLPLRVDHLQGKELVLHASAMGKVLMAFARTDIDATVASLGNLERFTVRTLATTPELIEELQHIRHQGYATNYGERYDGANGVAVPVLEPGARTTSFALGIQGPDARLTDERMKALVEMCRAAADQIAALNL